MRVNRSVQDFVSLPELDRRSDSLNRRVRKDDHSPLSGSRPGEVVGALKDDAIIDLEPIELKTADGPVFGSEATGPVPASVTGEGDGPLLRGSRIDIRA